MTVSFNLPLPVLVLSIIIIFCICRCFTQPNCLFLELSEYRNQTIFQNKPKFQSIIHLGIVYIYSLDRLQTNTANNNDNDNDSNLTNPSRSSDISDPDSCSICLDDYQCGDEVIKIKCGHIFHTECLEKWNQTNNLNPTVNCPLCNDLIYSRV